jgi:hypothetical protein
MVFQAEKTSMTGGLQIYTKRNEPKFGSWMPNLGLANLILNRRDPLAFSPHGALRHHTKLQPIPFLHITYHFDIVSFVFGHTKVKTSFVFRIQTTN